MGLLPRRCWHSNWNFAICKECAHPPGAQSACLRCSGGQAATVRVRFGPVCLKHERWHLHGTDLDVAALPEYAAAEHRYRTTLRDCGVGLNTGELNLANMLLAAWGEDHERLARRATALGLQEPWSDEDRIALRSPEIVEVTALLVDPAFSAYLANPRRSPRTQTWALVDAVELVAGGIETQKTAALASDIVSVARDGVRTALGKVSAKRRHFRMPLVRALTISSAKHRACLLRHLDTAKLPIEHTYGPTTSTRPARTFQARDHSTAQRRGQQTVI